MASARLTRGRRTLNSTCSCHERMPQGPEQKLRPITVSYVEDVTYAIRSSVGVAS